MLKHLIFSLLVLSNYSYACQREVVIVEYPLSKVSASDFLLEVKVSQSQTYDEGRYTGTKFFRATVLHSFNGGLTPGEVVDVFAANEDAAAVCPVAVETGKTYILVISKSKDRFEISRFHAAVDTEHPNYQMFIEQIKHASKQ